MEIRSLPLSALRAAILFIPLVATAQAAPPADGRVATTIFFAPHPVAVEADAGEQGELQIVVAAQGVLDEGEMALERKMLAEMRRGNFGALTLGLAGSDAEWRANSELQGMLASAAASAPVAGGGGAPVGLSRYTTDSGLATVTVDEQEVELIENGFARAAKKRTRVSRKQASALFNASVNNYLKGSTRRIAKKNTRVVESTNRRGKKKKLKFSPVYGEELLAYFPGCYSSPFAGSGPIATGYRGASMRSPQRDVYRIPVVVAPTSPEPEGDDAEDSDSDDGELENTGDAEALQTSLAVEDEESWQPTLHTGLSPFHAVPVAPVAQPVAAAPATTHRPVLSGATQTNQSEFSHEDVMLEAGDLVIEGTPLVVFDAVTLRLAHGGDDGSPRLTGAPVEGNAPMLQVTNGLAINIRGLSPDSDGKPFLVVEGFDLELSGEVMLNFTESGFFLPDKSYTLFDFSSAGTGWDALFSHLASTFTINGVEYATADYLAYDSGHGIISFLTGKLIIPEPATAAFSLLALAALATRRRRNK